MFFLHTVVEVAIPCAWWIWKSIFEKSISVMFVMHESKLHLLFQNIYRTLVPVHQHSHWILFHNFGWKSNTFFFEKKSIVGIFVKRVYPKRMFQSFYLKKSSIRCCWNRISFIHFLTVWMLYARYTLNSCKNTMICWPSNFFAKLIPRKFLQHAVKWRCS